MASDRRLSPYRARWLRHDLIAGVTLAAYAIPVSLAYATLAGLPPQIGVYGYLMGGLGYAIAGSSRFLAIGPTSAISLMIASQVGDMAGNDAERYLQIAVNAALLVGVLCLIAWVCRLSVLVKLISDSVLIGFKAGAGLTIAVSQLPALLGTPGGGHNVMERLFVLFGQLHVTNLVTLAIGLAALLVLWCGERWLPGRPIALAVVVVSIALVAAFQLTRFGVTVTGTIPAGVPWPALPSVRLRDQEGIVPLAMGCLLLAYIEGVAAARTFASKHGETVDPRRELLGLGAANLATAAFGGYPVAGGLSQTAVNEGAGARSRMSLVFASVVLAVCLVFLTDLLANLPKAVLAAVVLVAIRGLIDVRALVHMQRVSRVDFANGMVALLGVLLLGILQGILLAALISVLLLLAMVTTPHVAILGRVPGTSRYSDKQRHPDSEHLPGIVVFRPEASLLYLNADYVLGRVLSELERVGASAVRSVVCDLSASPIMDLAGAHMLSGLADTLSGEGIDLTVTNAHGRTRDLLHAEDLDRKIRIVDPGITLENELSSRLQLQNDPAVRPND